LQVLQKKSVGKNSEFFLNFVHASFSIQMVAEYSAEQNNSPCFI